MVSSLSKPLLRHLSSCLQWVLTQVSSAKSQTWACLLAGSLQAFLHELWSDAVSRALAKGETEDIVLCFVCVSRQLQDVAPQGGGLIAATILFLSLAWSSIDPQGAEAVYDIPYQVNFSPLQNTGW